ncbi:MAG: helix-turn-helix domain-containing protein [Fusobacterium sp.]
MNKEYSVIFNLNKQNNMRNFFLNDLVPYGKTTSHENIGNALNISRIGVTKILTKLQEKNLIITKKKLIKILSVPKINGT